MPDLSIQIAGIPYCQQRGHADEQAAKRWTDQIIEGTRNMAPLRGPCALKVVFKLPLNKFPVNFPFGPDLDNLTKRLFDSLNSTLFQLVHGNDSCVMSLCASKEKCYSEKEAGAIIEIDFMHEVTTYKGSVEFTIDGDKDFNDTIRLLDMKRRSSQGNSEISLTFKAKYFGEVFGYTVLAQTVNKEWIGKYIIDGGGRREGPINGFVVSENDGSLETNASWSEDGWNYHMKVLAKAESTDVFSRDDVEGT